MTPSLAGPIPVPPCLPPAASHPLLTLLAGLSLGWAGRKVPFFRGCSVCRGPAFRPPPLQAWTCMGVGQAWGVVLVGA